MLQRFQQACDFRTYRLQDTNPVYCVAGALLARRHDREIRRYVTNNFNRSNPVGIIYFLSCFVTACNQDKINEGCALWIIPEYLDGPPKELVLNKTGTTNPANAQDYEVSYTRVVDELIRRYATDTALYAASDGLLSLRQGQSQKALRFHDRLHQKPNRLGKDFDAREILEIFVRVIDDSIRAPVQRRYDDETAKLKKRTRLQSNQ